MPGNKQEIYDFLDEIYQRTKWPFIPINVLESKFGNDNKEALNLLRKEGKINKRKGFNKILIEILWQ